METPKWTFLQSFTPQFHALSSELETKIEAAKLTPTPTAESLQEISVLVTKATKVLADATGDIPTYDQRQYEIQLKSFEKAVESLRASSAPKSKFAFKRKAPVPASAPATSVAVPLQGETPALTATPVSSNSSNLVLSAQSHKYITRAELPEHAQQTDLSLSDLDNCIVDLLPPGDGAEAHLTISALHARNLSNCVLLLPAVAGSALLHDLARCTIVLGCHQFRMHSSKQIDIFLDIASNPIIEDCNSIRFSQYPDRFKLPAESKQVLSAITVQDFSHIRATPSPNHSSMDSAVKSHLETALAQLRHNHSTTDLSDVLPPK